MSYNLTGAIGSFAVSLLVTIVLDAGYKLRLQSFYGALYKKELAFKYTVGPAGKLLLLIVTSGFGAASIMNDRPVFLWTYAASLTAFGIYAGLIYRNEVRSS